MYIYANYNYYHRHRYCSLSRSVTTPVRLKENKIYDKCNMCPTGHFSHGHLYIIVMQNMRIADHQLLITS